jgi:hypothetical protein
VNRYWLSRELDVSDLTDLADLADAAVRGDVAALRRMGCFVDINSSLGDEGTALHLAAQNGHGSWPGICAISNLVYMGANIEARRGDEATPLHAAAQHGHVDAINILVHLGANIEARRVDEATPLHVAAHHGHVDAIKTLVDLGANIHAEAKDGQTPVSLAARGGHAGALKTLVELHKRAHGVRVRVPGANGVFVLHPARPRAARRGAQPTVPESWNPRDTVEEENDLVKAARDAAAFAEEEARANRNMMQMIEQEERDKKKAEAAQAAAEARCKGKGKGKGKAGGGPCTKAAAGSDEASTSKQGGCTRGTPPPVAHVAAATSGTQRPEPLSKKEKDKQRKERQRHAKIDTASKMMDIALKAIAEHGAR